MLDLSPGIDARAQIHPLRSDRRQLAVPAGATVAQIVVAAELDPRYGPPVVVLKRGHAATVVPMDRWARVRPKPGSQVLLHYEVHGPAIGALLSALVSAAAPAIASGVFGLPVASLGFKLAVAAITVVGGLLVNALIPPPSQPKPGTQDPAQFAITGFQNRDDPYGIVPKPLGRVRVFPKKSARGYTVTTDDGDIEFRGRYVIGWGPMALSDIRIGTTPIENFSGVEVEFLNVDENKTFNNQPGIGGITKAWRQGTELMTLYPDDVAEDQYSVLLVQGISEIRRTRDRAESADVDISFPQGLFSQDLKKPSKRNTRTHTFTFDYRPAAGGAWVSAGSLTVTSKQNSQFRRTHKITFPSPDEYDVRITQTTGNNPDSHHSDKAYLSAIRSFRSGQLPSHAGVAEIAIRVLASDQLNGQIDSLNMIVHQLVPVWDGAAWSAPQVSRHPAWILADVLRGPHLDDPVADSRIDLAEFKDWADSEPHWTCDINIESTTRLRDVVDIVCAAGRAKFALTDLKYSVVREKPSEPIRQIFTPRNSWGFKGRIAFPAAIHGLRCVVRSERLDWAEDEVIVYADGYSAANATKFETLRLPGVVIASADTDEGNVYRLGRYHLAASQLRPETFTFSADFEHLQVQRGQAAMLVHDVAVAGVGAARVKAVSATGSALTSVTLDEVFPTATGNYRVSVRTALGVIYTITATAPAVPEDRVWTYVSGTVDATKLTAGDLVAIEEVAQQSLEVLITGIRRGANETAVLTAVPRAPAVTTADSGTIPAYSPVITPPKDELVRGPAQPVVSSLVSDQTTTDVDDNGAVYPRLAVYLASQMSVVEAGGSLQLRWRITDEQTWTFGDFYAASARALFSGALEDGETYEVEVRSIGSTGRTRGWVAAGTVTAAVASVAPLTPVWDAADTSSGTTIENMVLGKVVTVRWENLPQTSAGVAVFVPRHTEVWRGAGSALTLDANGDPTNATLVGRSVGDEFVDTTADYETSYYYFLRAVGYNGLKSAFDSGRLVETWPEVGLDGNLVANGQFIAGSSAGWTLTGGTDGAGLPLTVSVVPRDTGSSVALEKTCPAPGMVKIEFGDSSGGPTSETYNPQTDPTSTAHPYLTGVDEKTFLEWSAAIPVDPDTSLTVSLVYGQASAVAPWSNNGVFAGLIRITEYDASMAVITTTLADSTALIPPQAGGSGLDTWFRRGATFKTQSNTAYVKLAVSHTQSGTGVCYLSDISIKRAVATASIGAGDVTETVTDSVGSTTLTTNSVEETIASAIVTVPDVSEGQSGESMLIKCTVSGNTQHSASAAGYIRLYVVRGPSDETRINTLEMFATAGFSISGTTIEPPGTYTIEARAESNDVANFTIREAHLEATVQKR